MSFFSGRRQQDSEAGPAAPQAKAALPPAPRQPIGFETVLGASAILSGDLRSQGNIRLDGIFEGTLEIDGNVLVGETAKITADVNARNISIAGAVRGNVNGNKVQILRTGRVWGDINAAAITTEEGAFIDGKITMVSHEAAVQGFEAPSLPEPANGEPEFLGELDEDDEVEYEEASVEEDIEAFAAEVANEPQDDADDENKDTFHFHSELGDLPVDEDGVVG